MHNEKLNLLLIVVDCLRADRCPPRNGDHKLLAWPRLCREGTCFTQMISSASMTPVCFASLLSGQYSRVHAVRTLYGPAYDSQLPNLTTILKAQGYATNAYMTGPLHEVFGLNVGFDFYEHRPRERYVYSDWGGAFLERFGKAGKKQPFFTLLHLFELHRPRQVIRAKVPKKPERKYDLAWRQLDDWIMRLLELTPENTIVTVWHQCSYWPPQPSLGCLP